MAKGKKTTPEAVYKIMASWAVTRSYKETADFLGLPVSTVKKIVDEHITEEKFEKLCKEKEKAFSKKADGIINKALARLERDIENEDMHIPVNHLTTVIGTLTDKILLLEGKPTENTKITFDLPEEVKPYAE